MNTIPKKTFCNPLNIEYAYRVYDEGGPVCIEGADPVMVIFEDKYLLFSSITDGYWWSYDMAEWKFIAVTKEQLETLNGYAPAIMVMDGYVWFHQGYHDKRMYRSNDPLNADSWEVYTDNCYVGHDPFLFHDKVEERVWASYGCDDLSVSYIKVVELDRKTLEPIGEVYDCIYADQANRGWERPWDNHTGEGWGYTEGSQIFRHKDRWYLTYSGYSLHKCYSNGVYYSDKPASDYEYGTNNPCSHKNTGYIGSAGHGAFFEDMHGNWWNVTCSAVYVSHPFERRINLYPAAIDDDGMLYVNSTLSDYPISLPTAKRDHYNTQSQIPWMLLSKDKKATVSSTDDKMPLNENFGKEVYSTEVPDSRYDHNVNMAFDEDNRTFWSAASGDTGEWICVDLDKVCDVNAIQLSFFTYNLMSMDPEKRYHQYKVEYSTDGVNYEMLADKTDNKRFVPHDYLELETPVKARFIKVTNKYMAGDAFFALGDFRIFGNDGGKAPAAVENVVAVRDAADGRNSTITWNKANGADGYIVKYGHAADKLYNQYQVYTEKADVRTLTNGIDYFFRVDSFNESGYTEGKSVVKFQ